MESWLAIFLDHIMDYNQGIKGKPKPLVVADYHT